MNNQHELSMTVSNKIDASIEKVFDAWLNPETLAKFMLPKPGMVNPGVEIDPRVGGKFRIDMNVGDDIIPHSGEYLEITRPNKLSFSWQSPFSGDGSRVTVELASLDAKTTEITLHHVRFPDQESRDDHKGGWSNILQALQQNF